MFEALLYSFPDFVLVAKKVRHSTLINNNNNNIMKCKTTFSGTKALTAPNEHLFRPVTCNLVNEILKGRELNKDEEIRMRQLEEVLRSKGSKFLLWGKGDLILKYNVETLKFNHFEMTMTISSFKNVPF